MLRLTWIAVIILAFTTVPVRCYGNVASPLILKEKLLFDFYKGYKKEETMFLPAFLNHLFACE